MTEKKQLKAKDVKVYVSQTKKTTDLGIEKTFYDLIIVIDGKDFVLAPKAFYSGKVKHLFGTTLYHTYAHTL